MILPTSELQPPRANHSARCNGPNGWSSGSGYRRRCGNEEDRKGHEKVPDTILHSPSDTILPLTPFSLTPFSCRDDTACVAFTYTKASGHCRLLAETGEYFSNPDADSGVKKQLPPQ